MYIQINLRLNAKIEMIFCLNDVVLLLPFRFKFKICNPKISGGLYQENRNN